MAGTLKSVLPLSTLCFLLLLFLWRPGNYYKFPFRYFLLFLYHFLYQGAYRAGRAGYIWSRLRTDVMRLVDYKYTEMKITNKIPTKYVYGSGEQDKRVINYD